MPPASVVVRCRQPADDDDHGQRDDQKRVESRAPGRAQANDDLRIGHVEAAGAVPDNKGEAQGDQRARDEAGDEEIEHRDLC